MALINPEQEEAAAQRAWDVRQEFGHPKEHWEALIERIQRDAIRDFSVVVDEYLKLMWCLDRYRVADAPPAGMGALDKPYRSRMDGIYRGKGNWFAIMLALLLENRTSQPIRSRSMIKGFSQVHQIDLAWPDRDVAPIVCAESKVTGGPAYRDYPQRRAMADWTNRRKELKFSATDLKLSRRDQTQKIGHWGAWRAKAQPRAFMLWGARLTPRDNVEKMIKETEVLLATYLDGAGIFAWRENNTATGYEPVPMPQSTNIEDLDTALWRIESEINDAIASGALKTPVNLAAPMDPAELEADPHTD